MDQNQIALTDAFEEYMIENHQNELLNIMGVEETDKHFSIVINFMLLFEKHVELGSSILSNASDLLPLLEQKMVNIQMKILSSIADDDKENLVVKTNVHVRVSHLPSVPQIHLTNFPLNQDVGNFVQVCATITRITSPKMLEYRREYQCSKCKEIFSIFAEYEMYYAIKAPTVCLNTDCLGKNLVPSKTFNERNHKDYQEIKIQEQVGRLGIGTVPRTIWATLEDDLVDNCKPGDDVKICGVVTRRWKLSKPGSRDEIELYLRVNHLSVANSEKMSVLITNETVAQFEQFWHDNRANTLLARDLIVSSICPQVYGLYLVKLAVAIVLAGGVSKQESGRSRLRGESHLLLVGDPGVGKSHILKFASKISSRAVHATGVGATSAGLTATAVHEQGEWQLEAGALVLADGGICCIDEFSSIREHDRTTIHEAMEQQTISVAKAGVVCKLNTRCKIIAATNMKGRYNPNLPLDVNIGIASPLLSRFDLILVLLDSRNALWDKTLSDFILREKTPFKVSSSTSLWSAEKLLEYFSVIKTRNPKLTADANTIFAAYYKNQRNSEDRNAARTTVRLLESLIRLSEGHARLMFREEVHVQDAIVAISLVKLSMMGSDLSNCGDSLHDIFPVDPLVEYKKQARAILSELQLYSILRKEMETYDEVVIDSNSQAELQIPRSLSERDEAQREVAKRNEDLAAIVTNMRRNKDKYMFDSLVRKPPPKRTTANKTRKSTNKKRNLGGNSNVKVNAGPSISSSDEDTFHEPTTKASNDREDHPSNEDDLTNLLRLSSDSEPETKPIQRGDRSSTTNNKKGNSRVVKGRKSAAPTNVEKPIKRKKESSNERPSCSGSAEKSKKRSPTTKDNGDSCSRSDAEKIESSPPQDTSKRLVPPLRTNDNQAASPAIRDRLSRFAFKSRHVPASDDVTLVEKTAKRKSKASGFLSSSRSSSSEREEKSSKKQLRTDPSDECTKKKDTNKQPSSPGAEKVDKPPPDNSGEDDFPLFSEFRAQLRLEDEKKRLASSKAHDKLIKFAHAPRRETEPPTITDERSARSSQALFDASSCGVIDEELVKNITQESYVDSLFSDDEESAPRCPEKVEESSTVATVDSSQKSLFPSQANSVSNGFVFPLYNVTDGEDLSILDDI